MNQLGAQETKRRRKALPPAIDQPLPVGCLGSLVLSLFACAGVFAATRWAGALALTILAGLAVTIIVSRYLYGLALLAGAHWKWTRRGRRCLVVYSNSPTWADHIRRAWLPRMGEAAVVLNWSDRASWGSSLAVRVFRRFGGGRRNFNPVVVVFRGLRQPHVFRFFYAFQQVDAGRRYLEQLEAQMFEALSIDSAAERQSLGGHRYGE